MPTFESMKQGYTNLWNKAKVTRRPELEKVADRIIANKSRYKVIEKTSGVPWFWIACTHYRESNLNFKTHLHCGDPLTARTVHVPAGRPKTGNPPFTFEESALDALQLKGLQKITDWSVERMLYEFERYNGWGYLGKGNSPYVWSGTDLYTGGKYVADHVYDPNKFDVQLGCAGLLKVLAEKDSEIKSRLAKPVIGPAAGGAAGTAAGSAAAYSLLGWKWALAFAITAIVCVGIYYIKKEHDKIKSSLG